MKNNVASMENDHLISEVLKLRDQLYGYALSLVRNQADAEDLLQDTYLKVMDNADKFDGANLKGWVKVIMSNTLKNKLKRDRRVNYVDMDDESQTFSYAAPMFSAPHPADQGCTLSEIRKSYNALNEDQRRAFVMYAEEGLSYDEIAKETGAAMGTVKSRISAGRKKLMVELKDYATTSARRAA